MDDGSTPDAVTASSGSCEVGSAVDDRWHELADLIARLIARRVLRLQRERSSAAKVQVATDGAQSPSELTTSDVIGVD
jgi:hypothetical protein